MTDLEETIAEAAQNPKAVTVDGTRVEGQTIDELIKADQYLAGKKAANQPNRGLRFNKLVPPGTT